MGELSVSHCKGVWTWGDIKRETISEPWYHLTSALAWRLFSVIPALICCNDVRFCSSSEIFRLSLPPPPSMHLLWLKQSLQRCPCPRVHACWHVVICTVLSCHCSVISWCHSVQKCDQVARNMGEPDLRVVSPQWFGGHTPLTVCTFGVSMVFLFQCRLLSPL